MQRVQPYPQPMPMAQPAFAPPGMPMAPSVVVANPVGLPGMPGMPMGVLEFESLLASSATINWFSCVLWWRAA